MSVFSRAGPSKNKNFILALNGESDVQIPAKKNLALISEALKAAESQDFTFKSFPKLNHLFHTSKTGLPVEYELIEETISPQVLKMIQIGLQKGQSRNNLIENEVAVSHQKPDKDVQFSCRKLPVYQGKRKKFDQ